MANILLRSPYFVTVTTGSHLSAQMALTIDGTLRYTILKNAVSNRTVFEIATLCKDYFVANYNNLDTVSISYVITTFTAVDGGGTATAQGAVTHTGYYGYSEFWDGVNQDFDPDDYELTNTGNTQIIYLPENTAGFAWDMNSGTATKATISTSATSVAATSGNYTWTIERVCSAKYSPIQMRFINKNGVPQDQYFFLKSVENVNTRSETFKRNIFVQSSSNYDAKSHQTQTFNKTGKKRFTLNTDYLAEAYNAVMEDIMLSEYVWIYFDSKWHPVTVSTSTLLKKTSVNDKLIQYTIEVEDANDIINNIL
jgi:predicted secreted protein